MNIKNHNTDRKKPVMRKGFRIAAFIAVLLGIVLMVFRYFGFVSKTVYKESVSHLTWFSASSNSYYIVFLSFFE